MSKKQYIRCSLPQAYYDSNIDTIIMKMFREMEESVGEIQGTTSIPGVKLDFNVGLRLEIPAGDFHVRISDAWSERIFFEDDVSDVCLVSLEKYAIFFQIDIWQGGQQVFSHTFNPEGQNIIFHCSSKALGDTLAFLPYARLYRDKFHCQVFCWVDDYLSDFIAHLYPDIPQVQSIADAYATYYLGTWVGGAYGSPVEGRTYPLWQIAGAITGVETLPPRVTMKLDCPRTIAEPYVCIGVQASTPRKGWHYPQGWNIITRVLKDAGYRVICIDKHTLTRADGYEITCPQEAEDMTGDFTLMERAQLLTHAECFIGLGSGLSWLAEAVNCPVVMISGFSECYCEFPAAYRVINRLVCHGCFNDSRVNFMCDEICPYHHGTERELECSKEISPLLVMKAVWQAINP